ncbi:chloramphenicol-sensitive protein RarD [Motilibacter rhizosphaerae]|uniref:Chloramphenicol-sensitive protein RarD n=1 Tax=Motilibacter rhizosphaerae TaxID=598652 RepID=A0A4Q7NA96_9ACTN|nr:EamA family transporter RarD [Motilibacter rhizosphaerae]RZS78997.1 chloramphenicol-sensitive protein RarD [Motilibacter rhizosphaerae]
MDRGRLSTSPVPAEARRRSEGVAAGLGAYVLWGVFPLYFPLLEPAGPVEILAHRITWTALTCAVVLGVLRMPLPWRGLTRSQLLRLGVAAVAIAVNWGVYIAAVNTGHVVEAALGYFVNPLVSVLLGVAVLGERLRALTWAAVGVAASGVAVLTVAYGHVPWIALVLALSFGGYGLLKKQAAVAPLPALTIESWVLVPASIASVVVLEALGDGSLDRGPGHVALLATSGLVTAVPLLLFGAAANRVPLSLLGLLQYVTPTLQLLVGVLVRHEAMTASRWAGFGLVWASLALLTADGLRGRTREPEEVPVEAASR